MMDAQPTLATLFATGTTSDSFDARVAIESNDALDSLRIGIAERLPSVQWQAAKDGVLEKVGDLLDIRLSDVLVTGWNKSRDLLKYRDREKYPPDKTFVVELLEHKIKSNHKPYIELLLNGQPVKPKIEFDVTISLRLKGFSLTIQDARIKAIHTGTLDGKGVIVLGGAKLVEKPLGKVALPGKISLGEGIAIA